MPPGPTRTIEVWPAVHEYLAFTSAAVVGVLLVILSVLIVGQVATRETERRERLLYFVTAMDRGGDILALAVVIILERLFWHGVPAAYWNVLAVAAVIGLLYLLFRWCLQMGRQATEVSRISRNALVTLAVRQDHKRRCFRRLRYAALVCLGVKLVLVAAASLH